MNDADIKSTVNASKTHGLARVYAGRTHHIFALGQSRGDQIAVCRFYPKYFVAESYLEKRRLGHLLDRYPLCKGCKVAFGKLTS